MFILRPTDGFQHTKFNDKKLLFDHRWPTKKRGNQVCMLQPNKSRTDYTINSNANWYRSNHNIK